MKATLLLAGLTFTCLAYAGDTDSTGLEGDNLDLYAVMQIFKESDSPEDFEKRLNTESSEVNNLDLNSDGEVDYIRVVDSGDSISHILTLQVSVNDVESQDIATIELEETAEDVVEIQIVGDEELYGENYIIMPESAGNSPLIVNVIVWTPVRFMWKPGYVFWVSPWRHKHYPGWYKPWKRVHWHAYHGRVVHHHHHCHRVYARSFTHAYAHHYHRTHSPVFHAHKTAGSTSTQASGKVAGAGTAQNATPQNKTDKTVKSVTGQKENATEATERKRPGKVDTSKGDAKISGSTTTSNDKGLKTKNSSETKASKTTEGSKKAKNNAGGSKTKSKTTKTKTNSSGTTRSKTRSGGKAGRH